MTPLIRVTALGACLGAASALPGQLSRPQTNDSARIARIERRLLPSVPLAGTPDSGWSVRERLAHHDVAGMSVAVIRGGTVAWARAYGVRDRTIGAPMDTSTILQGGSLSKPMAAAIGLSLVQDGTLTLDDDVNRWLRGWRVPVDSLTRAHPVTLRLLLSHRAGVSVSGFDGYPRGAPLPTVEQVLRREGPTNSDTIRVVRVPGTAAAYSGGGYLIAQQVMTDATGRSFNALALERLFRPLGLTRSTYASLADQANGGNIAYGYFGDGKPVPGGWRELPEQAPASLWTTASEYARFVVELQRASRGDTGRLLSPATVRAMMTLQGAEADEQGIGVGLKGNPPFRFSHTGWNDGFRSIAIGYLDRGDGIVVLTNADDGDELAMEYVRAAAREYGWEDLAPRTRAAIAVAAADRAAIVGRYRTGPESVIEIAERDGQLVAGPAGRRLMPLLAESRDQFFFTFTADAALSVERDATGRVAAIRWNLGGREVRGERITN